MMSELALLAEAAGACASLPLEASGSSHISNQNSDDSTDSSFSSDEELEEVDKRDFLDDYQNAVQEEIEDNFCVLHFLEHEEELVFDWQPNEVTRTVPSFLPTEVGPKVKDPLPQFKDYLELFISDEYIEKVVHWTNLNAQQKKAKHPEKNRGEWRNLTLEELKAFFGVQLTLELEYKGRPLEDLYSQKFPLLGSSGIADIFPRTRLTQVLRYLHFCDENENHDICGSSDELYKIRSFICQLQRTFQREYIPDQEVCVDETMVPFKGRLRFKQYCKDKPVKWGIKAFMLADSKTGYNYNFEIYAGKDTLSDCTTIGLASRAVVTLTKPLHGLGYHVYMDRFYTSPLLFGYLTKLDLSACGTVMWNRRGLPKCLKPSNLPQLEPGQSRWLQCQNIGMLATIWQDKRPIGFLSTIHVADYACTVSGVDSRGQKHAITAPPSVKAYNMHMGGVDLNGRMTTIDRSRKSYKWHIKLERKLLLWAAYNAYVIWRKVAHLPASHRRCDFRYFCREVAKELVHTFSARRKLGQMRAPTTLGRLTDTDHIPVKSEGTNHRCVVCETKHQRDPSTHKRSKTTFMCASRHCQAHLCIRDNSTCWSDWHHKKEYWH